MAAGAVAESYFEAVARRDLDAMTAHYGPDMVVDMLGQGILRGPAEMRGFFEGLFTAIPDAQMIVDRIVASDDVAMVQWRLRGRFGGGPLFGIEPTDAWIEQRGVDAIEVADGLIARNTVFQDGIEMLRSIGMMPPLDSPPERAMKQAFNAATRARGALRRRFGGAGR